LSEAEAAAFDCWAAQGRTAFPCDPFSFPMTYAGLLGFFL